MAIPVRRSTCLSELLSNHCSLSPAQYESIDLSKAATKTVRDYLDKNHPYTKGKDPGSKYYLSQSPRRMIRTKALQDNTFLIYPKGDSVVPVNPRAYINQSLAATDLILSKDSNIGATCSLTSEFSKDAMLSGGLVRLNVVADKIFLLSFLKHPVFRRQLVAKTPRGATMSHAGERWLDCFIPQPRLKKTHRKITDLAERIIMCETEIRRKNEAIDGVFEKELSLVPVASYVRKCATISAMQTLERIDTSMFDDVFQKHMFRVEHYPGGCGTYKNFGLSTLRGQNLQVSSIGPSIYTEEQRPNYYRLLTPSDLSEYRTIYARRYLGNKRQLALLKVGDVIFGAEGFGKGRVLVLAEPINLAITNIHGIIFRPEPGHSGDAVVFGCYLGYLRSLGILDLVAVGGSGGSLALKYFGLIKCPVLPASVQTKIRTLYHNVNFATARKGFPKNATSLGIWELGMLRESFHLELSALQDQVLDGKA